METPLELVFRNVEPSDEIRALVIQKVQHLETFYDGITGCHVFIRAPHKKHQKGDLYEVTIEVRVPGDTLVVRQKQNDAPEHEHMSVAVRDAFAAMARTVNRWKAKTAGDIKLHAGPLQGRVAEIDHAAGYGQIIATDQRLVYFHENSVVGGRFLDLQPNDTVELVVQSDESQIGPQASTVRKISPLSYDPKARHGSP